MSLALVANAQHMTLRWQARMLILWACVTGLACSALLLHRYAVHSMAIRYAASAGAMYWVGCLAGAYTCLRWWGGQAPTDINFPQEALPGDAAAYRQQVIDRRGHWLDISRWWNLNNYDDRYDRYDRDDRDDTEKRNQSLLASLLNWIFRLVVGLVLSILATLVGLLFGYLPILIAEALAGFLGLLVVKFVIGSRAVAHYAAAPMLSGYWQFALGKTGLAGLLCIAAAGAAGHWLEVSNPGATDLIDVVLPPNFLSNLLSTLAELPTYLPSFLAEFVH